MTRIEAALDRFEAAAKAAGFEIRAASPQPFDEARAAAALAERGLWRNEEQFAMLRRWNAPWLVVRGRETSLTVEFTSLSFETALRDFDQISPLADEFPENAEFYNGMFPVLERGQHDAIAYYTSGKHLYQLFVRDEMGEAELIFRSLADFFTCAASAIEQGIDPTFYLDNPDWKAASLAFARVCVEELPNLDYWKEAVRIEETGSWRG